MENKGNHIFQRLTHERNIFDNWIISSLFQNPRFSLFFSKQHTKRSNVSYAKYIIYYMHIIIIIYLKLDIFNEPLVDITFVWNEVRNYFWKWSNNVLCNTYDN